MGGVKTRRRGESVHRFWYKRGTDEKLTHVLRVENGKRSWYWAIRNGENYTEVPQKDCELR